MSKLLTVAAGLVALTATGVLVASAEAAPKTGAAAPAGLVPGSIARDWVKWDKASCSFKVIPRSQRPKSWTAVITKAPAGSLIAFGEQSESNPLTVAINQSMQKATQQSGAQYFAVNYNWPDTSQPVVQAQALVQRHPSVVVSFNVIGPTVPAVNKLFKDACIPEIQVTVPLPNVPTFGASNEDAGTIAGKYLVNYIKKHGWDPKTITMLEPIVPSLGVAINRRVTVCGDLFKQAFPQSQVSTLDMGGNTVSGQQAVTDWLTAHPASAGAQHIVACTIADIWATAVANALGSQNRATGAALVGQGASADGVKAVLAGGPIVASLWFDSGRYGDYMVPMALDILAGKPIPLQVHQRLIVVTPQNASKFYR